MSFEFGGFVIGLIVGFVITYIIEESRLSKIKLK